MTIAKPEPHLSKVCLTCKRRMIWRISAGGGWWCKWCRIWR